MNRIWKAMAVAISSGILLVTGPCGSAHGMDFIPSLSASTLGLGSLNPLSLLGLG